MPETYVVGQRVRARRDVWQDDNDYSPAYPLCRAGDVLVVRGVGRAGAAFPLDVSHEDRTDNSFGVNLDEIAPIPDEPRDRVLLVGGPGDGVTVDVRPGERVVRWGYTPHPMKSYPTNYTAYAVAEDRKTAAWAGKDVPL